MPPGAETFPHGRGEESDKAGGGRPEWQHRIATSNLTEVKTAQGKEGAQLNHPETKTSSRERGLTFIEHLLRPRHFHIYFLMNPNHFVKRIIAHFDG